MNWAELNRRLDELLEPEDAVLIIKRFGLDSTKLPETPTLRELVEAGNLSLGEVARILDPQPVYEPGDEGYPPEYLEAERRLDHELESMGRIVDISSEPTFYFTKTPEVVDEFGRPDQADPGVTEAEARWLAEQFNLSAPPPPGTALTEVVEKHNLDPQAVSDSLAAMTGVVEDHELAAVAVVPRPGLSTYAKVILITCIVLFLLAVILIPKPPPSSTGKPPENHIPTGAPPTPGI